MIKSFPDMNAMLSAALREMVFKPGDKLDFYSTSTAGIFTNLLVAKSMAYKLDAGRDLWLTDHRWPMLQRDYLEPERVRIFLDRCVKVITQMGRKGIVAQMMCRHVEPKYGRHIWGNCMFGFTLKTGKKGNPPTLGMHSRSCYIGYLGPLDCALAHVLARTVAERVPGLEVEDFRFEWYIDCMNWHPLKSVPWLLKNGIFDEIEEYDRQGRLPDDRYPVVKMSRKALAQLADKHERGVGTDYDTEPWSQSIRMNKRYQRTMNGDLMPKLPLSSLKLLDSML